MSYGLSTTDATSSWNPAMEDVIEGSDGLTWFNRRIPQVLEDVSPICDVINEMASIIYSIEDESPIADILEGISPIIEKIEGVSPIALTLILKRSFDWK